MSSALEAADAPLETRNAIAYNSRGLAYGQLDMSKEAEQDFAKAKELGYDP